MKFSYPIVNADIVAHRGASNVIPENTLASVRKTAELGAKWIETDVRLTADLKLVMIHDETLDRTTNGSGTVLSKTLDEIQALDAGSWFHQDFAGENAPDLEEYLDCVLECGLNLQLEVKEVPGLERELVERVAVVLREKWPTGERPIYLSGFSERCLRYAAEIIPDIPRCIALVAAPRYPAALAKEIGCQMIHIQDIPYNTPARLGLLKSSGVEFAVATVEDPKRARELLDMGAQSILSDNPTLL
jgi:glycerophosphoryl diester phosphodiesterase